MNIRVLTWWTLLLGLLSLGAGVVQAGQSAPGLINYQGLLTGPDGTPLAGGAYRVAFRLWSKPGAGQSGDTLVWGGEYDVTLVDGLFNLILGAPGGTAIAGAAVNDIAFAFSDSDRYFGITVVRTPSGAVTSPAEIAPRQRVLTSPYAFNAANGIPAGTILPFAGSTVPAGFLACDGSTVNRGEYPTLFAAIGVVYGAGDVSTTFALPNLKGRIPTGLDPSQSEFDSQGEKGGEKTHALTPGELPGHSHWAYLTGFGSTCPGNGMALQGAWAPCNTEYEGEFLDRGPDRPGMENIPFSVLSPYIVVRYIIKY